MIWRTVGNSQNQSWNIRILCDRQSKGREWKLLQPNYRERWHGPATNG